MRLPHLFLLAVVVLQLHMVEQLMFGLDELYELQAMVGTAMTLFSDADRAAVVLVFGVVTAGLLLCYGFMTGGVPRLVAASFFGLEFMVEGHHIIKTIVRGSYFPGAVTAIAFVALGAVILATARREFKKSPAASVEDARLRLSNI